jgi:hypothetical protein
VLEVGQDEGGAGDAAGFAGAGGDVLEGAPALAEQGGPAFARAAQEPLDGVAGRLRPITRRGRAARRFTAPVAQMGNQPGLRLS